MPICENCGNEHSDWGRYCPVCKAKLEAAEAEKRYWENKEFEAVKERIHGENRAILDMFDKKRRGEPVNVTARICETCGHTNGVHVKRCVECGSDSFFDVEL